MTSPDNDNLTKGDQRLQEEMKRDIENAVRQGKIWGEIFDSLLPGPVKTKYPRWKS